MKIKEEREKSRGIVILPYAAGTSVAVARILKKHKVNSAMKPHCTLRNILVHPKDKVEDDKKAEGVYTIP